MPVIERILDILPNFKQHVKCVGEKKVKKNPTINSFDMVKYDTIRDAILTCARKPT